MQGWRPEMQQVPALNQAEIEFENSNIANENDGRTCGVGGSRCKQNASRTGSFASRTAKSLLVGQTAPPRFGWLVYSWGSIDIAFRPVPGAHGQHL